MLPCRRRGLQCYHVDVAGYNVCDYNPQQCNYSLEMTYIFHLSLSLPPESIWVHCVLSYDRLGVSGHMPKEDETVMTGLRVKPGVILNDDTQYIMTLGSLNNSQLCG